MTAPATVGRITPTQTSTAGGDLAKLLPESIKIEQIRLNISHGTMDEFQSALPLYEECVGELAKRGIRIVQAAGTPPFMLLGYQEEGKLIAEWEAKYGVSLFTSGSNQVRALRALGVKKLIGIGYDFEDTSIVERYFAGAGFDVLELRKVPGPWEEVQNIPPSQIEEEIGSLYSRNESADAVHIQGGKIQVLDFVGGFEEKLGLPVLHPAVANAWEVMLRVGQPVPKSGFGRLLAEMPAL